MVSQEHRSRQKRHKAAKKTNPNNANTTRRRYLYVLVVEMILVFYVMKYVGRLLNSQSSSYYEWMISSESSHNATGDKTLQVATSSTAKSNPNTNITDDAILPTTTIRAQTAETTKPQAFATAAGAAPATSSMSTRADLANTLHMRYFENVCVDRNPNHKMTHLILYETNQSTPVDMPKDVLWVSAKKQPPPDNKEQVWIEESTIVMTAPLNNPNHLFWDVAVNLFQFLNASPIPFTRWVLPYKYPCDYWICHLLPILVQVLGIQDQLRAHDSEGFIHQNINRIPCFRKAWIPKHAYFRNEQHAIPHEADVLPKLQKALTLNFTRPANGQRTILLYGHLDSHKRHWINIKEDAQRLQAKLDLWHQQSQQQLSRAMLLVLGSRSHYLFSRRPFGQSSLC